MTRARVLTALSAAAILAGCNGFDFVNGVTTGRGVTAAETRSYGPQARQKLDIYRPSGTAKRPVVVFFYGGSWQEGERGNYKFAAESLAKAGYIAVLPDYRLSPAVAFPAFVQDGALAVAEVAAGIGKDRPIVVMGHSAGAHIASLLAYDPRYLEAVGVHRCRTIAGFIGLAGPYDFLPIRKADIQRVFPPATRAASQPIAHASGRNPPSLLLHGRDDTTVHAEDSTLMGKALRANGSRATVKLYDGVDHVDIMGAMAPLLAPLAPTRKDVVAWLDGLGATSGDHCRP